MNGKTRLTNHVYAANRFIRFVIRHFIQDDCTYIASALAFTSLLAVVPLMSVGLAIFSSFPVFQGLADPMQNFIFDNFVPATGKIVQDYLQQFTSQVSKLSIWGIVFLIVTALLMMFTIERAMNKIWRVGAARHGVPAFLLYWAILFFFNELIDASNQPFAIDADEMLLSLMSQELIHATADGHYMLSRDLAHISLYALTQLLPYRLPTYLELQHSKSSLAEQWRATFKKNDEALQKSLSNSLEELFRMSKAK